MLVYTHHPDPCACPLAVRAHTDVVVFRVSSKIKSLFNGSKDKEGSEHGELVHLGQHTTTCCELLWHSMNSRVQRQLQELVFEPQ